MSGYTRTDTTNNIADGNVISAADLDNEFNGVQAAFNSSTGHTHDGTASEGAPITKLGPAQDVTISTTVLGVKTTNTVDLGTSSLKFKDFYLAGNALIGGTLGVTGATTLSAALTYGGVTLSNAVTGTGNMVLSASPTLTGTITAAAANFSGAVAFNGTTTIGDADTDTITQAASYVTGTQLKSAKTATNTLSLAAYDVDGTAYTNLITLTASNTPTLALTSTGVGTINNMSIGATTASTGAFTTLTSTGASSFATSSGDVGIGTSSPAYKLDVSVAANGTALLNLNNTSTSQSNYGIRWTTAGTNAACRNWSITSDIVEYGDFGINQSNARTGDPINAGTTRLLISASGNLGIGVTSPAVRLDVSGAASTNSESRFVAKLADTSAVAQGNGGGLIFRGVYTGTTLVDASGIQAYKENATDGNYAYGLAFVTRANGGNLTTNMRLDGTGNLGLGVTPSAWTSFKVLQVSNSAFISLNNNGYLNTNAYYDGSWKYIASDHALSYAQENGIHYWNIAASGTAGNAITWTQAMTLDASGNLGVGVTSPVSRIDARAASAVIGNYQQIQAFSTDTSAAIDLGGGIGLGGFYNSTQIATFGTIVGRKENGTSGNYAGYLAFGTNAQATGVVERARIDSGGKLLLGVTTGTGLSNSDFAMINGGSIRFRNAANSAYISAFYFTPSNGLDIGTGGSLSTITFGISGLGEAGRFDTSGNLLLNNTTLDIQSNMLYWNRGGGTAGHLALGNTEATNVTALIYCNRQGSDGTLVEFRQANITEGSISVSGTTVTYGGGHLARFGQLPDGSEDPTLLKGTVLTNLDEMCVWINKETGIPADNEQCNKVKISDVDGDANVAGVFVSWSYDEQHDTNDLFVAMTGDMIIRIAQGVTVARGDLLMSAGDGTAKPQGDDIVRSKTVAKVTSTHVTCTYADGSYCVPCVLMAC